MLNRLQEIHICYRSDFPLELKYQRQLHGYDAPILHDWPHNPRKLISRRGSAGAMRVSQLPETTGPEMLVSDIFFWSRLS